MISIGDLAAPIPIKSDSNVVTLPMLAAFRQCRVRTKQRLEGSGRNIMGKLAQSVFDDGKEEYIFYWLAGSGPMLIETIGTAQWVR